MLVSIKNQKKKFFTSKNVVSILHNYYSHNNKLFFTFTCYTYYTMAKWLLDKIKMYKTMLV